VLRQHPPAVGVDLDKRAGAEAGPLKAEAERPDTGEKVQHVHAAARRGGTIQQRRRHGSQYGPPSTTGASHQSQCGRLPRGYRQPRGATGSRGGGGGSSAGAGGVCSAFTGLGRAGGRVWPAARIGEGRGGKFSRCALPTTADLLTPSSVPIRVAAAPSDHRWRRCAVAASPHACGWRPGFAALTGHSWTARLGA